MKLKKPKFWDKKKPNILVFLLWPLSPIIYNNNHIKLKSKKKIKYKLYKNYMLGKHLCWWHR